MAGDGLSLCLAVWLCRWYYIYRILLFCLKKKATRHWCANLDSAIGPFSCPYLFSYSELSCLQLPSSPYGLLHSDARTCSFPSFFPPMGCFLGLIWGFFDWPISVNSFITLIWIRILLIHRTLLTYYVLTCFFYKPIWVFLVSIFFLIFLNGFTLILKNKKIYF